MTLVIPNAQEVTALNAWINENDPWTLKLFGNNAVPAVGSVAGDFNEVAGGGYASKSLLAASWVITAGVPTLAVYAAQAWVFTGPLDAPGTVYGYFIVDSAGLLVCAELLAAPPYTPLVSGDAAVVVPQIAAQQIA